MAQGDSKQRLIWALLAAFTASLLLIAFLLGREFGRSRPVETRDAAPLEEPQAETPLFEPDRPAKPLPSVTAVTPNPLPVRSQRRALAFAEESDEESIELGPDGRFVLSNTRRRPSRPISAAQGSSASATNTSRSAASAASFPTPDSASNAASYFEQMGAIQSSHATAKPEAFAMALVEASARGDSRAFDTLIEDSARMQAQARQIQAPPGCEAHQQATLQMLEESHAMLEQLRGAVASKNLQEVTFMAGRVQSLQAKARTLQEMEAQILSRR